MSQDLIDQYLAELRARLRTPAGRTTEILAEAEDHLRESAAAGLAIGMTQAEAQEAAVSAFGTVTAVVRAHRRPSARLAALGLAVGPAAGVYLVTVSALSSLVYFYVDSVVSGAPRGMYPFATPEGYAGPPAVWASLGGVGLALLCGCGVARRVRRRRGVPQSRPDPLRMAVGFLALAMVLAVVSSVSPPHHHLLGWDVVGALALAAGYGGVRLLRRPAEVRES